MGIELGAALAEVAGDVVGQVQKDDAAGAEKKRKEDLLKQAEDQRRKEERDRDLALTLSAAYGSQEKKRAESGGYAGSIFTGPTGLSGSPFGGM